MLTRFRDTRVSINSHQKTRIMKHKTRIRDLHRKIDLAKAEKQEQNARGALQGAALTKPLPPADQIVSLANLAAAAEQATTDAHTSWMKTPAIRRRSTQLIYNYAIKLATDTLTRHARDYSGHTTKTVKWGDSSNAWTDTHSGEQYYRTTTYRKTNADHHITLDPAGIPLLFDHQHVVRQSISDNLSVIALYPLARGEEQPNTYRAVWVKRFVKQVVREEGWIASHHESRGLSVCYHSTKSAEHAYAGLQKKLVQLRKQQQMQARTRKEQRRARLVARLCTQATATIKDAKRLGFCDPGIRAFQDRYGIGDTATLSELVRTGDPSATRLALTVAHKIHRQPVTA